MPHAYFLCPDPDLAAQQGERAPVPVPVAFCLEHARKPGRGCAWNALLLRGMVEDDRPRLSYTRLDDCPRRIALKQRIAYTVDPAVAFWKLRGVLLHRGLELLIQPGDGAVTEVELMRPFPVPRAEVEARGLGPVLERWGVSVAGDPVEVPLVGRLDLAYPDRGIICDWKTAAVLPPVPRPWHVGQLSFYAWLAEARGWRFTEGEITYLTMREVKRVRVPLWPAARVEAWTRARLPLLLQAYGLEHALPPPIGMQDPRGYLCRDCEVQAACQEALAEGR